MKTTPYSIEPLEARIAPAALVGNILTYTDIDGDLVKVTFTPAAMTGADFAFSTGGVDGTTTTPQALTTVKLGGHPGAGFTLTATPHLGHGDSHANIDAIDGTNTDLGSLSIDGDVRAILAGTGAAGTVGLKSFTALSVGRANAGDGESGGILKNVAAFVVKTDVVNATLHFTGGVKTVAIGGNLEETIDGEKAFIDITGDAGTVKIGGSIIARSGGGRNLVIQEKVGTVTIGGSVIGGSADIGGRQIVLGSVTTLTIGGDVRGGSGYGGGSFDINGDIGMLKIGGSVLGGTGNYTGYIDIVAFDGPVKTITIGGSVVGGSSGSQSGQISAGGIGSLKIAGSLIGTAAGSSGNIFSVGNIGSIAIGHDFIGGNSTGNLNLYQSGWIWAGGTIGSIVIGGNFISGRAEGAGGFDHRSSTISADGTIGAIKIGGSILGDPRHPASITAGAELTTGAVKAIASLTVKGSVQSASILTGYDYLLLAQNTDSGIGSVVIGGDFAGSLIHAGDSKGLDGIPGTADDDTLSLIATITSVKVGGAVTGLAGSPTQFGIHAPKLLQATIGHATYDRLQLQGAVLFNSIGLAYVSSN